MNAAAIATATARNRDPCRTPPVPVPLPVQLPFNVSTWPGAPTGLIGQVIGMIGFFEIDEVGAACK